MNLREKNKWITQIAKFYLAWIKKRSQKLLSIKKKKRSLTSKRPKIKTTNIKEPQNVQEQKQLTSKKEHPINQVDTGRKMGPSSSSHIRLRSKYVKAAPEEKEYMSLLQNKLPLTKVKKQYYDLAKTTTWKFHYESAELFLTDYVQYMQKFQGRKEKSAMQYILDIKDVCHSADKSMCLFPNALKDSEMVELCPLLPQKRKLIENKDRDRRTKISYSSRDNQVEAWQYHQILEISRRL